MDIYEYLTMAGIQHKIYCKGTEDESIELTYDGYDFIIIVGDWITCNTHEEVYTELYVTQEHYDTMLELREKIKEQGIEMDIDTDIVIN